jgi:mRNA-degrading endonuclease RelE of RelBE toxin-antitoxin system
MNVRYGLGTAPPARRALADRLPEDVAAAVADFITGALLDNPRGLGKPLGDELAGIYSARLARDWCLLYEIDDTKRLVIVLDIQHRSLAHHPR